MTRKLLGAVGAVLMVVTAVVAAASGPAHADGPDRGHRPPRPVVFVHGGSGSGAQFESQALRLAGNGYPMARIAVHEYDSTFATNTMADVWAGLDALDRRRCASRRVPTRSTCSATPSGPSCRRATSPARPSAPRAWPTTSTSTGAPPRRRPAGCPPWRCGARATRPARSWAPSTTTLPDQSHVQVATSAETFAEIYEFLTGRPPRTTAVVPERGRIRISGEANLFPANIGAAGTTLEVWKVDGDSGARRGRRPVATFAIGADGAWGPFRAARHAELRAGARPGGRVGAPLLLPPVRPQRPPRAPAHVGAGHRHRPAARQERHAHQPDHHALQGAVGRPGRGRRRARPSTGTRSSRPRSPPGPSGSTPCSCSTTAATASPTCRRPCPTCPPCRSSAAPTSTCRRRRPRTTRSAWRSCRGRAAVAPRSVNVPNWASSQHHISIQFPDFA